MNPAERRLISYAAASHALVHVMELTYPALLTRIEDDFGIRTVVSGALATIFGWTFGSSAIPAGFLVDRLGSQRVVTGAFAGATLLAILVGLSPNEWFLAAALGGLGLTIGLYHPAGTSLLVRGVGQRGLALGWHGVAGNVGQALAPAVAVALAVTIDWRAAFFFLAGLAALLTLLMGTARLALPSASVPPVTQAPSLRPRDDSRSPGRLTMPLLLIYAAFVLSGTVYRGSITFLPKHLEGLVSHDLAGAFTTVALLTGAIGQLVGGTLSQRIRLERLAPTLGLLAVPALVLTGILSGAPLVVIASAFVFLYFANQPVFNGLIADYAPQGPLGRSYGFSFFANFGLGSMGGIIAGAFVQRWDTSAAFLALAGFLALTTALTLALLVHSLRRPPQPVPVRGEFWPPP